MIERDISVLRRLRPEDIPAAFELSAQAGWNQTRDDWQLLLDLTPEGCLAIEVGGVLAATTTLFCYDRKLAWVGMVLTKMEFQRRGFAKELLETALKQADKLRIGTIKLDATDQGQPLYHQFGFQAEQKIERWSRMGKDVQQTCVESLAKETWQGSTFDVFPANRWRVLQQLARRCPPLSSPHSFLFSRPGRAARYLGPCVSEEPATARTLIEHRVQNTDCSWYWDLFPNNKNAATIANALGFSPQRHLTRMYRGKQLPENENATYAIAGFELG